MLSLGAPGGAARSTRTALIRSTTGSSKIESAARYVPPSDARVVERIRLMVEAPGELEPVLTASDPQGGPLPKRSQTLLQGSLSPDGSRR